MTRTFDSPSIEESKAAPWGHLPIDVYLVENWTEGSQHRDLVNKFLALGPSGRAQYNDRTITPTETQISSILQPYRPASLRAAATNLDIGVCLRLDYTSDETSQQFWDEALTEAKEGAPESVIVDDKALFDAEGGVAEPEGEGSAKWRKVLDLLPEIVTHADSESTVVDDTKQEWRDASEEDREEIEGGVQNYSVVGMVLVEDAKTHGEDEEEKEVLQLMLDGCGNVVKSLRQVGEDAAVLFGDWSASMRESQGVMLDGDLGREYEEGGGCAPPYEV